MRQDHLLQQAVIEALDFEPSVNSALIGVAVRDGIVTLSGHVPSIVEKRLAAETAGNVKDVKAVVNDIGVELPGRCQTRDEIVAERAYGRLASNISVPMERLNITVENGVVTLSGDVDWHYQRQAAEADLHVLDCVREIRNEIAIRPPVDAELVGERIRDALARVAPLDASRIEVTTDGSRVKLTGTVNTWHERGLAESAVWSVQGVTGIEDNIKVA